MTVHFIYKWTDIIEAVRPAETDESSRERVMSVMRKKLEVADTEDVGDKYPRGCWKGPAMVTLMEVGVREEWMMVGGIG